MAGRRGWVSLAIVGALAAVSLAWGNHLPVSGDARVAGGIAPGAESPVVVVKETLSIVISAPTAEAGTTFGGARGGFGTSPVRVRAEYQLRNPSDVAQVLPLAFPVFAGVGRNMRRGGAGEESRFVATQDGKPLKVTADAVAGEQGWVQGHQKEWIPRLDVWVAAHPDVGQALERIRQLPKEEASAGPALHAALQAKGVENSYGVENVLTGAGAADERFRAVILLMPYVDSAFAVQKANGKMESILRGEPAAYEAHRAAWTARVEGWLLGMEEVKRLVPALKAEEARVRAYESLYTLLRETYGVKWGGAVARMYAGAEGGNPFVKALPAGAGAGEVEPLVPEEVAAALWPDVAKAVAERRAAAAKRAEAWGVDTRMLSPFTGKLYHGVAPGEGRRGVEGILAAEDGPRALPVTVTAVLTGIEALELWRYTAEVPAHGESTVVVAYDAHTDYDAGLYSTFSYAVVEQFSYILETVKYWKSFGPIDVTVTVPAGRTVVIRPALLTRNVVAGGVAYSGRIEKVDGNLHVALLPTAERVRGIWELLPAREETVARLRTLLAGTEDKMARALLHGGIARVLTAMHRYHEAWEEVLAGKAEAGTAGEAIDWEKGVAVVGVPGAVRQVWEFIEEKARSPRLIVGERGEQDPAKNELIYFERGSGNAQWLTLLEADGGQLARRVGAWRTPAAEGDVEARMSWEFMMAYGGKERDAHVRALVELALAHEEAAWYGMRLLATLPGDKGAALPLVMKQLLVPYVESATARAALELLGNLGGAVSELAVRAATMDDLWIRGACLQGLRGISEIPADAIASLEALDMTIAKEQRHLPLVLEIFSHNKKEGVAALRRIVARGEPGELEAAAILAREGDLIGVDLAVEIYNTVPFTRGPGSHEPLELSRAVEILAQAVGTGVIQRLQYRQEFSVWIQDRVLMPLGEHPEAGALAFAEAFYEQHCKGVKDLRNGWIADVLVSVGDARVEGWLREMAPHGNMDTSCAAALGELLWAKRGRGK